MISSKAYTEVHEIIKNMPIEMRKKIPETLVKTIEYNMDKEYKINIENFEKVKLLEDTEKILSVIYTDYLSTEKERKIIVAKERAITYQKELEKRNKYPVDFMKKFNI